MKISVSAELMQRIVNYLEDKPHKEVSRLILDIMHECNPPSVPEVDPEEKAAE